MGAHTVTVGSCGCSSPVALAFEPVVEINLLPLMKSHVGNDCQLDYVWIFTKMS